VIQAFRCLPMVLSEAMDVLCLMLGAG